MKFYKAEKGTPLFEEYGEDLIPAWRVAMPEFGNSRRKDVIYAEPEDIAKAIREVEDDMDLYATFCELADMSEEWENSGDNWGEVADRAAAKLGVEI
ncbi:MAG: hypothetical protein NC243_11280 [Lachnoclostridium sp.]|nr:hypothetical protein [Lachnoclostridium sp.]MCM1385110.1 hypothetical protein [Lachnoclostridium sp.]